MEIEEERKRHRLLMEQLKGEAEARQRHKAEHFANIAIKPLDISRDTLQEAVAFFEEAMASLDVSPELREILEEWCDSHDA
jgi:hypothetical protein